MTEPINHSILIRNLERRKTSNAFVASADVVIDDAIELRRVRLFVTNSGHWVRPWETQREGEETGWQPTRVFKPLRDQIADAMFDAYREAGPQEAEGEPLPNDATEPRKEVNPNERAPW